MSCKICNDLDRIFDIEDRGENENIYLFLEMKLAREKVFAGLSKNICNF